MIYFSHIRAGLISTALLLTTALASPALAENLPEISPRQIAGDVTVQYNPDTGAREYIAPSFDPFEEDREMAGTASLRSVGTATSIDGQTLRGGALLDLTFYYSSPSSDPYDVRGYEEAVYLSGENAPVTRRDNRVLECSEKVRDVVYYHEDYYSPSLHVGLYRPYRHYRGHYGYGNYGYDYGYGYGHGRRGYRSHGRRHRGYGVGGRRHHNGDRHRSRDRRRDGGVNGFVRDVVRDDRTNEDRGRGRDRGRGEGRNGRTPRSNEQGDTPRTGRQADRTPRVGRTRDGRRAAYGTRDDRRSRTINGRMLDRTPAATRSGRRGNNNASQGRTPRAERAVTPRASTPRAQTPRAATPRAATPRVRAARAETPRSTPRTERAAPAPRAQRAEPRRTRSEPRPARAERNMNQSIKSRNAPRRGGGKNSSRNTKIKMMNFFPMASAWSRNVVRSVDTQCAREEMLTVHIPQERLDAARFDGLTVLVLDRTGQEIPVFIPPNYIEGFRSAVEGRVTPNVPATTYSSQPSTPVYRAPVTPNVEMAPCPAGTTKQDDGTCLTSSVIGGYPRL